MIGDPDDRDVSWASAAQAEAVLGNRVYRSFDELASNPDEDSDVEWMLPLQREALEMSDAAVFDS